MAEPTKQEIQDVFKKLSIHRANKNCFDCHASIDNNCWTSIPFGIFLCTDCGALHRSFGTHVSFVRSTVLDKWTWEQLRAMTVGGNAAAKEYFSKYPGSDTKDAKTKYSSKIGLAYKEKLAQKVKDDLIARPGRQGLENEETSKSSVSTPASANAEDDFFNTWNQPKKPSSSTLTSPQSAAPPVVGLGSATRTNSSTLTANRPVKSTLTSARKTGMASKPMKLGAKKTGTISFEEAEARAKAEAERIEKIGFEAAEEERLQKLAAEKAKAEIAAQGAQANNGMNASSAAARTNYYQANTADNTRVSSEDMERLGMGMGRMGFGAAPAAKPVAARSGFGGMGSGYSPQVEENTTAAREKFGNQKGISSDQYFGRNNYDADAQAEASSRLQSFSGATSISSNQYFGRPEDSPSLGSEVTLSSLSNISGSELAKKIGQADLATIKNAVQTGAGKLTDILQDMQARYNYY
ncbi:ADP-ribosylation factor GTPase activating protein, ER-Golgi transport [Mortierella sp. 14UC]|nr:ADP-ribosylation factor GTPase activating protein, ER-Golgi transport [Mortierella sp. 14UC]